MRSTLPLFAAAAALAACSGNDQRNDAQASAGTEPMTAAADAGAAAAQQRAGTEQAGALGLSVRQLEDADIRDATGREIGEVERVETDASGNVTGLLVEIEDTDPDRYAVITLDGLKPVQDDANDPDDQDLQSSALTRDQLLAMPAATK